MEAAVADVGMATTIVNLSDGGTDTVVHMARTEGAM